MGRVADLCFEMMKAAAALLLAGMVVMVFGNVFLRYVFNSGIVVSEELARWFLVWMTFLGATVALRERRHLGMDSLVKLLSRRGRKATALTSHLLMLMVTWLLLSGSWTQMWLNIDVEAPVTGLSTGWFYGAGVFFGALAIPILLHEVWRIVTDRATDDELIGVTESEDLAEVAHIERDLAENRARGAAR